MLYYAQYLMYFLSTKFKFDILLILEPAVN